MAVKLAFFFIFFIATLYMIQAEEPKKPEEKSASETLTETFENIKTGAVEFFDKIKMIQAEEPKKPEEKSASETLTETFENIKTGAVEFFDKIKNSEFVQNATKVAEEIGQSVQKHGKDLANKFTS